MYCIPIYYISCKCEKVEAQKLVEESSPYYATEDGCNWNGISMAWSGVLGGQMCVRKLVRKKNNFLRSYTNNLAGY